MTDLIRKDPFYDTYVKTSEELTKLREAHIVLISMIKSNHINLKNQKQESAVGSHSKIDNFEV